MKNRKECLHLLDALSDYIDGDLGDELCAELESHLTECENCRIVVDTLRKTITLYRSTSQEAIVPVEVRERLLRRLDLDEFIERSNLA